MDAIARSQVGVRAARLSAAKPMLAANGWSSMSNSIRSRLKSSRRTRLEKNPTLDTIQRIAIALSKVIHVEPTDEAT